MLPTASTGARQWYAHSRIAVHAPGTGPTRGARPRRPAAAHARAAPRQQERRLRLRSSSVRELCQHRRRQPPAREDGRVSSVERRQAAGLTGVGSARAESQLARLNPADSR